MELLHHIQRIEKNDPTQVSIDNFMAQLDKAILQEPYVLISIITSAREFLQQHPFPEVLNRLFNTLAKIFGDKTSIPETKLILFRIVQLTRESQPFLHAYQTPEVFLRVIMMVSHNLDPEIRALCLMLLDGLAVIVCNDSHAQHLIIEGLSAPTLVEKTAALTAVKSFVQHSKQFCELVILRFDDLLFSAEVSPSFKVSVIRVLPYFKDSVGTCEKIYELGKRLLQENLQQEVTIAIFNVLTAVAEKGMQVEAHATFLMDNLEIYKTEPVFVNIILKSLAKISHSNHWHEEHVKRLLNFYPLCHQQKTYVATYYFIQCLVTFTNGSRFLQEIETIVDPLVTLLSHDNYSISIGAARILVNLQETGTSAVMHFLPSLIERMTNAKRREQRKFCKVIADYCSSQSTTEDSVQTVINCLIASTTMKSSAFEIVLETLNSVCAKFAQLYPTAIQFSQKILDEQIEAIQFSMDDEMNGGGGEEKEVRVLPGFKPHLHLISLLLAPQFARSDHSMPVQNVVTEYGMKTNYSIRYDIAVMAFRYGYWRKVALPLLESIPLGELHSSFASWIKGLVNLAKSEPEHFTSKELSNSQAQMKLAQGAFENLTTVYEKGKFFKFSHGFLDIFTELIYLLNNFVSLINANQMILSSESMHAKRGIATQCKLYANQTTVALEKMDQLYQSSFDMDDESGTQLFLIRQFLELIHFSFGFFCLNEPSRMPNPFFHETNSPTNAHFLELISWARSQLSKLYEIEKESWKIRITEENVCFVKDVLFKLLTNSFYLPRAFFHFVHSTNIRLNVRAEGKEIEHGKYIVSGAAPLHPVTLEGFVETNNPAGIKIVTVNGSMAIHTKANTEPFKPIHQRVVELVNGAKHFSLNFTFHVQQTSKIRFDVSFLDEESGKTWHANVAEEIIVQIGAA